MSTPRKELQPEPMLHVRDFSDAQWEMIRKMYAPGATQAEFVVLIQIAIARNLNPLLQQCYFVKRKDGWKVQVSIDELRSIAERSGHYAGQDKPIFTYEEDGRVRVAEVAVYRDDWPRPMVAEAHFDEYAVWVADDGGKWRLNVFWERKSHIMLAKCAEALALRKAFPQQMAGLYTGDETGDGHRPPVSLIQVPRPDTDAADLAASTTLIAKWQEAITLAASQGEEALKKLAQPIGDLPAGIRSTVERGYLAARRVGPKRAPDRAPLPVAAPAAKTTAEERCKTRSTVPDILPAVAPRPSAIAPTAIGETMARLVQRVAAKQPPRTIKIKGTDGQPLAIDPEPLAIDPEYDGDPRGHVQAPDRDEDEEVSS